MRNNRLVFVFIITTLFSCTNTGIKGATDAGGWHALIEQNSLHQWSAIGDKIWVVDQNSISVTPKETTTYLQSVDSYDNFHLKFEFWVNDNTNSGVFFRCSTPFATPSDINPINCHEANIWDNHPNQSFRTGSLVTRVEPSAHVDTLNRWNSYEVIANDSDITLIVNGKITAKLENASVISSPFALQYAGKGIVKFRNIYIKKM